jgi:hypothetical protein
MFPASSNDCLMPAHKFVDSPSDELLGRLVAQFFAKKSMLPKM